MAASESLGRVWFLRGQASGFGRNQAPKTDRLNQVPSWEFRNRRKSFTPRQLARILWDFTYLCWANPEWLRRNDLSLTDYVRVDRFEQRQLAGGIAVK